MNDFIQQAVHLAKSAAELNEFPVGALVVHEGQVIGQGMNQKESLGDPTAHAEVMAIRDTVKWGLAA